MNGNEEPTERSPVPRLSDSVKTPVPRLSDSAKSKVPRLSDSAKSKVPRLSDSARSKVPRLSDSVKTPVPRLSDTGRQSAPNLSDSGRSPVPNLSDSTKLSAFSTHGWLDELLMRCVNERASDLHIMAGERPRIRVRGELCTLLDVRPLVAGEIDTTLRRIVPSSVRERFDLQEEVDFSYRSPEGGHRFRVSVFRERRGTALAIRRLSEVAYTLEALRLPIDLCRAIYHPNGLVLIAGHAGAGKTTTLFSILQEFCERRKAHLITLEDPIEYRLEPRNAYLEQRELGRHFGSYREGVKDALRASPDCLVLGELRDMETIRLSLQAAEAGLLVIATVHAYDATRCVTRMINAFPVAEQQEARIALAYSIRMIAAQTLLQRLGGGRIPSVELCLGGAALSTLIREGKEHEIATLIESSRGRGMRTMDQSLIDLARRGHVRQEEAIFRAVRKENVQRALQSNTVRVIKSSS